jgi:glutamate/aspartate transport system substrate-binding protein
MFVTGTKLLVRRDSGIRYFGDLHGKTVVLTRGTVQAQAIPRLADDDVQLYGMLADTKSGSAYRVVGEFLTYADYALMLRKDDPDFAAVVERAFARLAESREIVAIYEKWFLRPLPSGVRLNLPMSPHLAELFRVQGLPTD